MRQTHKGSKNVFQISRITYLFSVLTVVVALVGWVRCIIKFTECDYDIAPETTITYAMGSIFVPLGAIVGWMELEDK